MLLIKLVQKAMKLELLSDTRGWLAGVFAYGRVGHKFKECRLASEDEKRGKLYGEWLKAGTRGRPDTPRSNQKNPKQCPFNNFVSHGNKTNCSRDGTNKG